MTVLVIADGAGLAPFDPQSNAVRPDTIPTLFDAMKRHGFLAIAASGTAVGLDPGQAGNSEVGHLTIGAGRIVPTVLSAFAEAVRSGDLAAHPIWTDIPASDVVHLVGLLSLAGTHGHWRTLAEMATVAAARGRRCVVHCILDGVDSQAGTAPELLASLTSHLSETGGVSLGVVMGRKWFCDRSGDHALSRYCADAIGDPDGLPRFDDAVLAKHLESQTEADFPPHAITRARRDGAPIILTQNREDRARQIAQALDAAGPVYSLIDLDGAVPPDRSFFPKSPLNHGVSQVLRRAGVRTLRVSETCKFPHVTFFLNGRDYGAAEDGLCLPSHPEAELARHPEMRASDIAEAVTKRMDDTGIGLIVVNLPNLDQIGHLGVVNLAEAAAGHVDRALARICAAARMSGRSVILTADHGNAERLVDDGGRPFGSHTANDVPFCVIPAPGRDVFLRPIGGASLANIAASVLTLMEVDIPPDFAPSLIDCEKTDTHRNGKNETDGRPAAFSS
jgi:2,3-bisphosphoglycerate-independent phosphoglycerate mutase